MSGTNPGLAGSSGYQIRTKGRINERWSEWFEGVDLNHEADGTTVIRCPGVDQAALHGLLTKVRDLGLQLISVTALDPADGAGPDGGTTTQKETSA